MNVTFVASSEGPWRIDRIASVAGEPLEIAPRLTVYEGAAPDARLRAAWALNGFTSNLRYTEHVEATALAKKQQGLNRSDASRAVLIPMRKNAAWWAMAQDERRTIFEAKSHHIAIGMEYLPAIARRLHHAHDLGGPFDFLTWFEFAPEAEPAFDAMLVRLRRSAEWCYVEREVEVRLSRAIT